MLEAKDPATLKETVDAYGIENRVSEEVGHFSPAAEGSHHIIIEDAKEKKCSYNVLLDIPQRLAMSSIVFDTIPD